MDGDNAIKQKHFNRVIRSRSHVSLSLESLEPLFGLFTSYEQLLTAVRVVSNDYIGGDVFQEAVGGEDPLEKRS